MSIQLQVHGLLGKENLEIARGIAQDLFESNPKIFLKPDIHEYFEFDWRKFLDEQKHELKGEYWNYSETVLIFKSGVVLGSHEDFAQWAERIYGCCDYRPLTLYRTLAEDNYKNTLYKLNRIFVSMLITIDGHRCGALFFELYSDILPKTCENFRKLCTGELGPVKKNPVESYSMHYKGTLFFRLVKNGWIQGGDVLYNRGDDGCSIYGPTFEDENFAIKHDRRGILSMANAGRHTNSSQFVISLSPAPWMNNVYVAFGRIIEGSETLQKMEEVDTVNERPVKDIRIEDVCIVDPLNLATKFI